MFLLILIFLHAGRTSAIYMILIKFMQLPQESRDVREAVVLLFLGSVFELKWKMLERSSL